MLASDRHTLLKVILTLCLILRATTLLYSQDTIIRRQYSKDYKIYFEFDKHIIKPWFKGNGKSIDRMFSDMDSIGRYCVDSIVVVAQASPEGVYEHNLRLSQNRTKSMRDYIVSKRPDVEYMVKMDSRGEAWRELRERIVADTILTEAQKASAIAIIDSDIDIRSKKRRMERLSIYGYLWRNHYPPLRYSAICKVYYKPEVIYGDMEVEYDEIQAEEMEPLVIDTIQVQSLRYTQKELFYLRTNLLVPLLNFGAEVAIGNHWSIGADYYFPWKWRNPNHKNCFELLAWGLEGRYWFGKDRTEEDRMEGHSVGVATSLGYYDFQRNYVGNQGEFINVGFDYLYALPIFKDRMHLEFSLGIGYIYSYLRPYEVYEDGGKGYRYGYTKNFHWFGPTKATVSFVVPIKGKRRLVQW